MNFIQIVILFKRLIYVGLADLIIFYEITAYYNAKPLFPIELIIITISILLCQQLINFGIKKYESLYM